MNLAQDGLKQLITNQYLLRSKALSTDKLDVYYCKTCRYNLKVVNQYNLAKCPQCKGKRLVFLREEKLAKPIEGELAVASEFDASYEELEMIEQSVVEEIESIDRSIKEVCDFISSQQRTLAFLFMKKDGIKKTMTQLKELKESKKHDASRATSS